MIGYYETEMCVYEWGKQKMFYNRVLVMFTYFINTYGE